MKCNKCKDKKCSYRNKAIEEYTIICSEGCTKEIREEATSIMNSENFINLSREIASINYISKPAKLFKSRLIEVVEVATNLLVDVI